MPLGTDLKWGCRVAVGPAHNRGPERNGFLLDLITGTDDDAGSLQTLADAGARWLSSTAGSMIECGAVLYRQRTYAAGAGSTPAAAHFSAAEEGHGDGPTALGASLSGPVLVNPTGSPSRWQAYRSRLLDGGYGAALVLPLELRPGSSGALVFLAHGNYAFITRITNEAAWFAEVASQSLKLALDVHGVIRSGDNLKQVLESRTSIDVACGVLMAQNRCSYPEAFSKLAGASRHRNLKVRSVADSILSTMPSGAAGTRFEPPAFA
ncbi:ANTAR domain-containing protein [Pseudarthrobacter sp. NPDC058196]|uniref:ANTAR domain-containing protein n=1 Tax=Pseudarthrobacter sp. NPDC058196 TaxID=3346376 RepID=UPI0036DAFF2C